MKVELETKTRGLFNSLTFIRLESVCKAWKGEAFGQEILDFIHKLSPECFAATPDFGCRHALDSLAILLAMAPFDPRNLLGGR